MGKLDNEGAPEAVPLTRQRSQSNVSQSSSDSGLSVASAAFMEAHKGGMMAAPDDEGLEGHPYRDIEDGAEPGADQPLFATGTPKKAPSSNRTRQVLWLLGFLCVGGWLLAFVLFLTQKRPATSALSSVSTVEVHDPHSATGGTSYGKAITLDQVLGGAWQPQSHAISWIDGPNGEDGLLVEMGESEGGYLRVEDIQSRKDGDASAMKAQVLMKKGYVWVDGKIVKPYRAWPSPDLKKVLLISDRQSNWRHSYYGKYWIFDVATQTAEALDPDTLSSRVQLAHWSPNSDAVVFVRENNLYLRNLSSSTVVPITKDGGKDLFYGVPDWVYEEEVLSGNSATWWSRDGKYLAFMRTEESEVPEYPVQYFLSRPSGKEPPAGLENYPEVRQIKYPKAGAPNPVVHLEFYDVEKNEVFSIHAPDDFEDDDRIIIEVVWASEGNVLIRVTNRESDIVKIFLMDAKARTGKMVRSDDVASIDGGWVEPSQSTRFIPADSAKGREHDGYVDTIIYEGYDHLAYFSPLNSTEPVMLTEGDWEVVSAPSGVNLEKNLVYFIAAKESPTQRHVYEVKLDGTGMRPLTDTSKPGYYRVSFSSGTGYALLSSDGPAVPWQAIINTQGDTIEKEIVIEENQRLVQMVEDYALPVEIYTNITIDGVVLQALERRPPHFNPAKKYPVLFYMYQGPGSQEVNRRFTVDFQAYIAASLGYIVVTVDGRGTGFIGREQRCKIRGNLGHWEAHDQIEAGKIWASKPYVDANRLAIWGWSFGGFMTLKVLEQDAGKTFSYGMAVAPVTDWRYYGKLNIRRKTS